MRKFNLLFALIILLSFSSKLSNAQAPNWVWAKSAGGIGGDVANTVAVDGSGNSYVAGYFRSATMTVGSTVLTNFDNSGSKANVFLAKYDANGNVLWAKSAGGTGYDAMANSIAVDASGNSYIVGYFKSSTLNFGTLTLNNASTGGYYGDIFIAKYDANGNVIWAKKSGGASEDWANSIAVDGSGNLYIAGFFRSTILTIGTTNLTNADNTGNTNDIFFAKYDTNGNVIWAKSAGGSGNEEATSIVRDASGKIYLAGYYTSSTITFGTTILTNAGGAYSPSDVFIVKYDANGNVLWAKGAGGGYNDAAKSIAVDASGNSYITGYFGSTNITFGTTILNNHASQGYYDIFLAKYDANGNVLWAKSAGGTDFDWAYSVSLDGSGNAYITGGFKSSSITFGTTTFTNTNLLEIIYLTKYDANGNVVWASSAGGTGGGVAYSVATDVAGNAYVVGLFLNTTIFGTITLPYVGYQDIFLAKIGNSTDIADVNSENAIDVFPNPAFYNVTINAPQKAEINIFNIKGQLIKNLVASDNKTTIDISELPIGLYVVKVKTEKAIVVCKFVKE